MISEKDLRLAAEAVGEAMISQLPPPSECTHVFSERFEEKMASVLANAAEKQIEENSVRIQPPETFISLESKKGASRMSKKRIVLLVAIIAAIIGLLVYAVADDASILRQYGISIREQKDKSDDTKVVASFREYDFTERDINVRLAMNRATGGEMAEKDTTEEVVEQLVIGKLMLDEAEKMGLTATDEEIASFISDQKEQYNSYPDLKKALDEYCAGAGITIEEHWAILEQSAPETVTRNKLTSALVEAYLADHPGEEPYNNPELTAYLNDYKARLLDQYRDEIIYH